MRLVISFAAGLLFVVSLTLSASAQTPRERLHADTIAKIKEEGQQRSKVMETISFLTDVHGPRLTGSPITREAGEWTKGRLTEWGLENARLETWGTFGRGWTLENFTANLVEPNFMPLIAFPKAWSPSMNAAVRAKPIYLDVKTEADLDQYRGKLHRAIVLISPPREVKALFEPPAARQSDERLLALANSDGSSPGFRGRGGPGTPGGTPPSGGGQRGARGGPGAPAGQPPAAAGGNSPTAQRSSQQLTQKKWDLCYEEGAAVVLEPGRGDGGTIFVSAVTMPSRAAASDRNAPNNQFSRGPRPWAADAPTILPQVVVAVEHYNRLVRMVEKGSPVEVEIDLAGRYHTDDLTSFNVLAEIPGGDLKDEVVMLGGHFDSWHSGTGATDNAVGCGVALEAVRILQAIGAKPRRTIRIALWTGEEQGLLGSQAYVAQQFGRRIGGSSGSRGGQRGGGERGGDAGGARGEQPGGRGFGGRGGPPARYEIKPAHEKFCGYFNLDNGTGKIRGIYLQGNEAVRPIFRSWLSPFGDLGASTITPANTGGTDHLSFDGVGLPGFQFIQDPLEYDTRTHHSSMDVFERIQEDDVKQASIIMASFVYHAAMRDEKLPRKPLAGEVVLAGTAEKPAEKPAEGSQP
jgi:carboxypeptidase Q